MPNERLKNTILEIVDNQLASEDNGIWEDGCCSDEDDIWKGMAELLDDGLKYYEIHELEKCQESWESAWQLLKKNVTQAPQKLEVFDVDEATDYEYGFGEWLTELTDLYLAQHRFEKLIEFCKEVKETFAWEETAPNVFNELIGNSLYYLGRIEESDLWFDNWLDAEPDNSECIYVNMLHWISRGNNDETTAIYIYGKKLLSRCSHYRIICCRSKEVFNI